MIQKLVPYTSAVWAEHVFRWLGHQGNSTATTDEKDNHINILIEAAKKLRDLVKEMGNSSNSIKGYIIYTEESDAERSKKQEEQEKLKELIKENKGGDGELLNEQDSDEEDAGLNEQTAAIIKKFKGKILKEFIPHFMLK